MADPAVILQMKVFKQLLLNQERASMVRMAQQWGKVERSLLKDIEKLVESMQKEGITPERMKSREFQRDRLASLLAQTRLQIANYSAYAAEEIESEQRKAAKAGVKHSAALIRAVANGIKLDFKELPVGAVEFMVGSTASGAPLQAHLQRAYGEGAQGMIDMLIESTAKGRNPRETARAMVRQGLSKSLNRMLVTARTEKLRVYRESNRRAFIHSGVVTSYLRSAARDSRTCVGCLAADGWEYQLTEHFASHPTCRCALIPRVRGLPTPSWQRGPSWFAEQPEAVKLKMLGPTKYDAYKNLFGGDLQRFVHITHNPIWGDGIVTASLKQLGLAQVARSTVKLPTAPVIAPASPQPVTEALAATTAPDIKPVRDALKFKEVRNDPLFGNYTEGTSYQLALRAIEAVHDDGILPDLEVRIRAKGDALGSYAYSHDDESSSLYLAVYENGNDHKHLTFVHEVGHFLDHKALDPNLKPSQFASSDSPLLKGWRTAVENSKALKEITKVFKNPDEYRGKMSKETAEYLLSYEEIWARSYAQYIAVKGGEGALTMQLGKMLNDNGPYGYRHWDNDDFAPIEAEIDKLFAAKGWLK